MPPERKYQSIDQIPLPRLEGFHGRYESIDPKISNLVRVINGLGVITLGSCEGHLRRKGTHPYPWVTYFNWIGASEVLTAILDGFNQTSDIKWEAIGAIQPMQPMQKARSKVELARLQESAKSLTQYLFDKYFKVPTD